MTGPDSLPIEGAVVTVTSISGNVNRTARTDGNGRFTVTFPGGDGDYMVSFVALGFVPKRFEVRRTADQDVLVADARLQRVAERLADVKVSAPRAKVGRNDLPPDVSGTERPVESAALPAADLGDLAAMAATLPGVQLVPGEEGGPNGFSVLGLGADQNNTTLNGMQFGGSNLPRDAAVSSSLATSPYDVSRGGFSGAQFSLRTRSGSNFVTRGMSLNLDAPPLQWSDRAARSLGQEYTTVSLGGLVSGPITTDRAFYNISYQLGRRANDFQSLLNTDVEGLEAAGVSPDSVERLLGILGTQQVPTTAGRFPGDRLSDQGSVFGSLDFAPPTATGGHAFNVSFNGSWTKQSPVSAFATELPAFGGERTSWNGGVQGRHSGYLRNAILTETTVGLSRSRNQSEPYLELPGGAVRVSSEFGNQLLSFGGSQSLNTSQTTTSAGFLNQLSWFSTDNKHRLRLTTELRREAIEMEQATNVLGTFSFNSLADLEAGRPSSYTRQLAPRRRNASQLVGGLSLGDSYRRSDNLQLQYGVRVDGNRFLAEPRRNPEVERVFGVRNDRVPSRLYASPRVGFSWSYGTAPQIAGFLGAVRGPRAVVRGGAGLFQNTPGTNVVASALDNTGLPGAARQLTCVGAATPVPDWDAYAAGARSVPDRCADGSTGTVFANNAPNVTLLARDFAAPRSVRSNLQWSGPVLDNRFALTVDGTYSLNLNQAGAVDLNFNSAVRFTLPDEGGRPVFVRPTSIVPATGAIAVRDARTAPEFSRVTEMRSDLRSESRQLSLRLAPARFSTGFNWSLSYVLSSVRERARGFTGTTAGNPLDVEWARSPFDARHQVTYNLGYNLFDFVRFNWFGRFSSGAPYTPVVGGDVNGDGYLNDRAFVFDPAAAADPALSSGLRSLLDRAPDAARDCLTSQLGRLAARNSCRGPWTSTAAMSVTFNPLKVRMPQRATLSFQVSNPLGAADLLLHGNNGLRGWGQPAFPDATLLTVRGFDPQAQRYRYDANPRFGRTNPALAAFRAPVTLTAMLRFDVGPTRERQLLTQQLDRGRRTQGTRPAEAMLKAMLGTGGFPNPMATILRQQDSLALTSAQADSLATLNRWYTIRLDSIWSPVAKHLAELPDDYDRDAAYDRYLRARRASVDLLMDLAPGVKGLLTAEQRRKLPPFVSGFLEPRYLASIRSGTATFTGGGMLPGGAMLGAGGAVMMQGGGGAMTVIRQ